MEIQRVISLTDSSSLLYVNIFADTPALESQCAPSFCNGWEERNTKYQRLLSAEVFLRVV